MLTAEVQARLSALIPVLTGRVRLAADLSVFVKTGKLPNTQISAFVLPLGVRSRGGADAMVNAFTQMLDELIAVLIVVRTVGDGTGGKSLPEIDTLKDQVIAALCGWAPANFTGVFEVQRGALISADEGLVTYQLDFAIQNQLRLLS